MSRIKIGDKVKFKVFIAFENFFKKSRIYKRCNNEYNARNTTSSAYQLLAI